MATVTTPNGETFEGVSGALLDYYLGEAATVPGYVIDGEAGAGVPASLDEVFPKHFVSAPVPAKSAHKDEWVAYAVSLGADADEAEQATKDDLIAEYGS